MTITLDRQVVLKPCETCQLEFVVVRGSVFEEGEPVGLYLVALHGHSSSGRVGHLALGLRDAQSKESLPVAMAIEVVATPTEFRHSIIDWRESAWAGETYLGRLLDRQEALESPLRSLAFHVADHLLHDVPEVENYFA